jgi:hypothetical protein
MIDRITEQPFCQIRVNNHAHEFLSNPNRIRVNNHAHEFLWCRNTITANVFGLGEEAETDA